MRRILRSGLLRFSKLVNYANRHRVAFENERLLGELKAAGEGCRINGEIVVTGKYSVELGSNVHIGKNAFIRGEGGLKIGDNTHISRNLVLYTINHQSEGLRLPYDETQVEKPVVIGKNVWVGMNVCIAPGSTIGDGAIIGMGCVVFGEVPPLAIIGCQKWRVLGSRDEGHYERLESEKLYGGVSGRAIKSRNS